MRNTINQNYYCKFIIGLLTYISFHLEIRSLPDLGVDNSIVCVVIAYALHVTGERNLPEKM